MNGHDIPRYRIAYGSVPKDGGTFTFYRNLRPALAELGIELICVSVGRAQAELVEEAFVDEGCVMLAADTDNVKEQARAFVRWCESERMDVVMAINSIPILSALPHLPVEVRVVARCANAFDEGYQVTLAGRERLQRIIALTPRLRDDLVNDYGVSPNEIVLIPNGTDAAPYDRLAQEKPRCGDSNRLELGFLGRLEHGQKGVLQLPAIVGELLSAGIDFHLRIAGKGRHESELKKQLQSHVGSGRVEFMGALAADEVPPFLHSLDVFLFTSRFEGCPNALLEAMTAGAVPVAFAIEGIIDFIIDDGQSGFVVPARDCAAFARAVAHLAKDPRKRAHMASTAARVARARFDPRTAAAAYARVFEEVIANPAPSFTPRDWEHFIIDPVFNPGWRALVPRPLKKLARRLRR